MPAVIKTKDGLQITVKSLLPIMVAWKVVSAAEGNKDNSKTNVQTGDNSMSLL